MIRILESALNPSNAEYNPHYRGRLLGLRPELVEEIMSKAQAEGIDPHELLNYAVEAYLK